MTMLRTRLGVAITVAITAALLGGCAPSVTASVASTPPAPTPAASAPPPAGSTVTAQLAPRELRKTGVAGAEPGLTCNYELTWVVVQNLDPGPGPALNKALDLTPDPQQRSDPDHPAPQSDTGKRSICSRAAVRSSIMDRAYFYAL
jgi:hypothetical protein